MKRATSWALLVAGTALAISAAPALPAAAATSGSETLSGTIVFAGSFTGTISGRALLARNPDGTCSTAQVPRHEVDKFAESGTLSF
jgi:hypothetical protein